MDEQIRILDYMHISCENLNRDSNFWWHITFLKYLNKHFKNKYFFYLCVPEKDIEIAYKYINYDNVKIIPMNYEFFSGVFRSIVDFKNLDKNLNEDIDVLFCNTPEVANYLLSFLINRSSRCILVNYSHWLPNLVIDSFRGDYDTDEFLFIDTIYILNYFIATKNLFNSEYAVKKMLDYFNYLKGFYIYEKLKNSFNVLYLMPDNDDFANLKHKFSNKNQVRIVFNHRHASYTGFKFFIDCFNEMIKTNNDLFKEFGIDDIKIILTSLNKNLSEALGLNKEYILSKDTLNRNDYLEMLRTSDIIIGTHDGSNQWSLSFLDGIMAGCIPLFRQGIFFDEIFEGFDEDLSDFTFKNKTEFIIKLKNIILKKDKYFDKADRIRRFILNKFNWDKIIYDYDAVFTDAYNKIKTYETDKTINLSWLPDFWNNIKEKLQIKTQRGLTQYRKTLKLKYALTDNMNSEKSYLSLKNDNKNKIEKQKSLLTFK